MNITAAVSHAIIYLKKELREHECPQCSKHNLMVWPLLSDHLEGWHSCKPEKVAQWGGQN